MISTAGMSVAGIRQRKCLRLQGFDYSTAGGYFVTLCTFDRQFLFGRIVDTSMEMNRLGAIITEEWLRSPSLRPGLSLDQYVVMPNHFHGILHIDYPALGRREPSDAQQVLPRIIAGFKSSCTRRMLEFVAAEDYPEGTLGNFPVVSRHKGRCNRPLQIWQRSYYDQIIRNDAHLDHLRRYISNNVLRWALDSENPHRMISQQSETHSS